MDAVGIEVTRGGRMESRHAVDVIVATAAGTVVLDAGDVETPVFPRSAIKAWLALPLLETGIADRLGLDAQALALACASHEGSDRHVSVARAMLAASGRTEADLACGAHWPLSRAASSRLAASEGAPCPIHNNCSGKHAGLIALAVGLGLDPSGYERPDHGAMRLATDALAVETGCVCDASNRATDGCSIPTHAIPLRGLARAFARLGTGEGVPPARQAAAARLRRAVADHPVLLSGTGRFDTVLTEAAGEALFIKGGAEGVWCAALPEAGLGIAVKARDGAGRAAQAAMVAMLGRYGPEHLAPALADWPGRRLDTWRGAPVGEVRVMG